MDPRRTTGELCQIAQEDARSSRWLRNVLVADAGKETKWVGVMKPSWQWQLRQNMRRLHWTLIVVAAENMIGCMEVEEHVDSRQNRQRECGLRMTKSEGMKLQLARLVAHWFECRAFM